MPVPSRSPTTFLLYISGGGGTPPIPTPTAPQYACSSIYGAVLNPTINQDVKISRRWCIGLNLGFRIHAIKTDRLKFFFSFFRGDIYFRKRNKIRMKLRLLEIIPTTTCRNVRSDIYDFSGWLLTSWDFLLFLQRKTIFSFKVVQSLYPPPPPPPPLFYWSADH